MVSRVVDKATDGSNDNILSIWTILNLFDLLIKNFKISNKKVQMNHKKFKWGKKSNKQINVQMNNKYFKWASPVKHMDEVAHVAAAAGSLVFHSRGARPPIF